MTPRAAHFLKRVTAACQAVRELVAARLTRGGRAEHLDELQAAIAAATGRDVSVEAFAELYAQTLACSQAVMVLAGQTLGAAKIRRWLWTHAPPWWKAVLAPDEPTADEARQGAEPDAFAPAWRSLFTGSEVRAEAEAFVRDCAGEDPVIQFYERFLARHDADRRARHGVFYTPRALAAHVVDAIDGALVDEFQLADGLADTSTWQTVLAGQTPLPPRAQPGDPFVTILDPAAGTGVFLVEVIERIHRRLRAKWSHQGHSADTSDRLWNAYVPQHLLPRLYGIELLLPAGLIAYLRVVHKLAETGFTFETGAEIQLHVANTLAGPAAERPLFTDGARGGSPAVAAARAVCYARPVTVLIGNPPFSGISQEHGRWMADLLRGRTAGGAPVANYFALDGQPLGERKLWLQDDYVKFLRYAHWKIECAGCGVIGFVTNHGYLDNPTFRGLRQQLLQTFPRITVLDLHGNRKKKEQAPDGTRDENVFGIDAGIAIGLFRRPPRAGGPAEVEHADVWGTAAAKLLRLAPDPGGPAAVVTGPSVATCRVTPRGPSYRLVPQASGLQAEYERGARLPDIMPVHVTAPVTARDHFVVAFEEQELLRRLGAFCDPTLPDDEIRRRYFTRTRSPKYAPGDTRGWQLAAARRRLAADPAWRAHVRACWYRPFDRRVICWAPGMIDWPRTEVMRHVLAGDNLALIARRQMLPSQPCNYFWITDALTVDGVIRSDNRGTESLFPLYLRDDGCPDADERPAAADADLCRRRANFSDRFVADAARQLRLHWLPRGSGDLRTAFGPEDLLHYCYALFFSASYRHRYAEWLRTDFPRVFLPRTGALFAALCERGAALIDRHLLRGAGDRPSAILCTSGPESPTAPACVGRPRATQRADAARLVGRRFPQYDAGRVLLNPHTWFDNVPAAVWEYCVGGHQVCKKWWQDRRGRPWTPADVAHYGRIVAAIRETLDLVTEIDQAIDGGGGWPGAFLGSGE